MRCGKRRATGRPSRLGCEQLQLIPDIYAQGAILHGFPRQPLDSGAFAAVIESRFGVHYDHDHVGRLMQKLGLREPKADQGEQRISARGLRGIGVSRK